MFRPLRSPHASELVCDDVREDEEADDARVAKWHVKRRTVNNESGGIHVVSVLEGVNHWVEKAQKGYEALLVAHVVTPPVCVGKRSP